MYRYSLVAIAVVATAVVFELTGDSVCEWAARPDRNTTSGKIAEFFVRFLDK